MHITTHPTRVPVPQTVIFFLFALILVSALYILFSWSIGSDVREYLKLIHIVNTASTAVVATALFVLWRGGGPHKYPLIFLGTAALFLAVLLVVLIDRYASVYPESNALAGYTVIAILDFIAAVAIPLGFGTLLTQKTL